MLPINVIYKDNDSPKCYYVQKDNSCIYLCFYWDYEYVPVSFKHIEEFFKLIAQRLSKEQRKVLLIGGPDYEPIVVSKKLIITRFHYLLLVKWYEIRKIRKKPVIFLVEGFHTPLVLTEIPIKPYSIVCRKIKKDKKIFKHKILQNEFVYAILLMGFELLLKKSGFNDLVKKSDSEIMPKIKKDNLKKCTKREIKLNAVFEIERDAVFEIRIIKRRWTLKELLKYLWLKLLLKVRVLRRNCIKLIKKLSLIHI